MTEPEDVQATCTRAEAAAILGVSVRTVARMVKRGDLDMAYTPSGSRRILRASVIAVRDTVPPVTEGAHKGDSVPVTEYARLAMAYGALAQSVDAYLAAGILSRRSARSALRSALEAGSALQLQTEGDAPEGDAPALPEATPERSSPTP